MPKKKLVSAEVQASWFARIRKAHQQETTEDYIELLADLLEVQGEARLVDLARRLGVAHPTASKMLLRLKEEGYVENQPYRSIFLTEKGWALAKKCKERHHIVLDFLIRLGIEPNIAQYDAEGIEHHISDETLEVFKNFKV
ncbi:MAG: manganese-binding transcriptional regulator MntR [Alphaproteobacteria bacterium]